MGAAFDSTELVTGQPRAGFIATAVIAAGKPLPQKKIETGESIADL